MTLNGSNKNVRFLADRFLIHKIISRVLNNKPVFDRNLTFLDHVSQSSTGGQDGYAHIRHF